MCTLIAAVGQFPGFPLVIAANRDEALRRPSSPPLLWRGKPPFVAPRDEQAGGTWLGLNRSGLFVGITNRFGAPKDPARRSRGALVLEALAHEDVASLHAALAEVDPGAFNAFHLLYSDRSGAAGVTWTNGELHQELLGPGVHIVTERSFEAADRSRVDFIRARWPGLATASGADGSPDVQALQALLSHHDEADPLASTCVHAPQFDYGTRSSMVLLLRPSLSESRLWWAEGSPCRHAYVEQPELIAALSAQSGRGD